MNGKEIYDLLWSGERDPDEWIRRKSEVFDRLVPANVRSVLDVGCGDGRATKHLGKRCELIGLDWSINAVFRLKPLGIVADILSLPLSDESVDAVVSSEVLEHLPSLDACGRAAREMERVARHLIVISVPNEECLEKRRVRCGFCGHVFHAHYHYQRFDRESWKKLFPRCRVRDITVFGPPEGRSVPWLYDWQQSVGNKWWTAAGVSCPDCGYADVGIRPNAIGVGVRIINRIAERLRRVPYWQIVVLEKGPIE